MNRIFRPRGHVTASDGTDVSAFLNATDSSQGEVPWGALGQMSIASGRIGPRVHASVHVHPVVTQVTYVVSGELSVRMKDASAAEPYDLALQRGEAVVVEPRTLFQLRNDSDAAAEVLYLVSPSYVFELERGAVRYDDAIVVAETWEALAAKQYDVPALQMTAYEAAARRAEALRRLARDRGPSPRPLAAEAVQSLKADYDYLAPDASEIRLLVTGEHGGLAHCVLPAGKTSTAVQHRTVEELWYVLEGAGEVWRGREGEPPRRDAIQAGDSLRIPVGTAFQFRAAPAGNLKMLIVTMPPWPGPQEAVPATGGLSDQAGGSSPGNPARDRT